MVPGNTASAAVLFVDVLAAFDEVMRELFLERMPSYEAIVATAPRLGWTSEEWHVFRQAAASGDFSTLDISQHIQDMLCEAHRGSWLAVDGVRKLVRFKRAPGSGTR